MEVSKIQLSPAESELMQNAEVILTKNRVLEKIKGLMETVQEAESEFALQELTQGEMFRTSAKISRGENYGGLPYLILDYPRHAAGDDLFFIRHMFWWGNFFSSTLQLSGKYRREAMNAILSSYSHLSYYYIGINDDPWVHHFEEANYRKIPDMTEPEFAEACHKSRHLKIATWWALGDWKEAPKTMYENWLFLLKVCGQLPRR